MVNNIDMNTSPVPCFPCRELPEKIIQANGNVTVFLEPLDPQWKINPDEMRPFVLGDCEAIQFRLDGGSVVGSGKDPSLVALGHAESPSPTDTGFRPAIWLAGIEGKANAKTVHVQNRSQGVITERIAFRNR